MANPKQITAGALRQIKATGYTNSCGEYWSQKFFLSALTNNLEIYFHKTESAGAYMDALEKNKEIIDKSTQALLDSCGALVVQAKESNKQLAGATGKIRANIEYLSVAIEKLAKVSKDTDLANTAALMLSLVDSLERLAVLEQKGVLGKIMQSMTSGGVRHG
jgi:hypothetical protein